MSTAPGSATRPWAARHTLLAGVLTGVAAVVALAVVGTIMGTPPASPAVSGGVPSSSPSPRSDEGAGPSPTAKAPTRRPTSPSPVLAPAKPGTALAALATLPVKGRAPMTGYARVVFGPAWEDVDHNGCDTRNDILRRDLTAPVLSGACKVLTGTLHDPYTGKVIVFVRGPGTSTKVQIDHVVALGDAWQKGAQQLSPSARLALANDPLELLAVDGPTNERKGDGDAATWLPPNKAFRCQYVARQVAVKVRYHLWVTIAERAAIAGILAGCPGQLLPAPG